MSAGCPIIVSDGTANMVDLAYDKYSEFASNAYQLAVDQISSLGDFSVPTLPTNVAFNIDGSVYGFIRPDRPVLPVMVYNDPGAAPAPPVLPLPVVSFDTEPVAPDTTTDIVEYVAPSPDVPVSPGVTPSPIATAYTPDQLALVIAQQPTLQLPDVPTADILPPDASLQVLPLPGSPGNNFAFTPEQYTSALLTRVSGQVSTMLDGGTGLPAAVAQALRDRANVAVDVEEARQVEQAYEEFAGRGFEQPPGVLAKRVAQVHQASQNQRAALNRDIYVQEQQVALENLRFAVTQGVALESSLMQGFNDYMRLSLEAMRASQEIAVSVFTAEVGLYNVAQTSNQIAASIERDRAQTAIALARLQLDAQKERGELTEQQYVDALRTLDAQVAQYRANLEGRQAAATSEAEDNRARLDAFRASLQATSEVRANYDSQWRTFSQQWETNEIRARVSEIITNSYAARVQAYAATNTAKIDQAKLGIAMNDMSLRSWQSQLDMLKDQRAAETSRLASLVAIANSEVELYRADAAVETSAADVNLRMLMTGLEQERARTETALKNAEMAIQQMLETNKLLLAARDTIARTAAQLAASSMSAVNFSAGIRSDLSQSYGCDTHFNYSGSVDTPT